MYQMQDMLAKLEGISKDMCRDCLLGIRLEITIHIKKVIDRLKLCNNLNFF